MAYTYTTTLTTAVAAAKMQKDLIPVLRGKDLISKFAAKLPVERGEGNVVKFNRLLRLDAITSFNLSETTTTSTPVALTSNAFTETLGVMGCTLQFTKVADIVSLAHQKQYREEIADQIIRSKAYVAGAAISNGCLRHRVDNDSTYEVTVTPTSGSTTTFVESSGTVLGTSDNTWGTDTSNWGWATGIAPNGANYDITAKVTDFVGSGSTATTATVQQAWDTTSQVHVVRGTGLAAGDKLTLAALTRVAATHERFGTEKFAGGRLYAFINTAQKQDLYNDATYQIIAGYSKPEIIGNFEVIPVLDHNIIVNNDGVYREDVDGSANQSTGIVHVALSFGKNAYNLTKWGEGDDWGLKIHIFGLDAPDTGNYYGLQGFISWHCMAAVGVLRATSIVGLMTGATALPIDFA